MTRPLFTFIVGLLGNNGDEPVATPAGAPVPLPAPALPIPQSDYDTGFLMPDPTENPTLKPSLNPTGSPLTPPPTPLQELQLFGLPTSDPTAPPTASPTKPPTKQPTNTPTQQPTPVPSVPPTVSPTESPTKKTTTTPTAEPTQQTTSVPTATPTDKPTSRPTMPPTNAPTGIPTGTPTAKPTDSPTDRPTQPPTPSPTDPISTNSPTFTPTIAPTPMPSKAPTSNLTTSAPTARPPVVREAIVQNPTNLPDAVLNSLLVSPNNGISYRPGKLTHNQSGLLLSAGLAAKVIARSGEPVKYRGGGTQSDIPFHGRPDAGQTFPDNRPGNQDGWIYVSNSEMRLEDGVGGPNRGGVGAIVFNKQGKPIKYEMVLSNTTWNCGGGKTPWGSWVSCEEQPGGNVYQVDPYGVRKPQNMTMGAEGGTWESFTYDLRNMSEPHFYLTEDASRGAVQRFTPNRVDWKKDPWKMLHRAGTTEYLKLIPNAQGTGGQYRWIKNKVAASTNAFAYYPNVEGIDSDSESVFFVSKKRQELYELNLADNTYTNTSTVRGKFNGRPDQIARILASGNTVKHEDDLLYFTEESGRNAGKIII